MKDKILILGAYSSIGKDILTGILKHTNKSVIATGRNREKLDNLSENIKNKRCYFRLLDANDPAELAKTCKEAALAVNCIGPYALNGAGIAETILRSECSYIDFAYEQSHYKKCIPLDSLARQKKQFMIVGAGMASGLSSLFIKDIMKKIPGVKKIDFFYLEGSLKDPETGFGSLISGALEASVKCESYHDARLNPFIIGHEKRKMTVPEGAETEGLTVPTIDDLVAYSKKTGLESIKTHFAMDISTPPFIFSLLRLTNPLKNKFMYKILSQITRDTLKKSYMLQKKKNINRQPVIIISVDTGNNKFRKIMSFDEKRNATSYLPVILVKKWCEKGINNKGLIHVSDILDLGAVLKELEKFGWKLEIRDLD